MPNIFGQGSLSLFLSLPTHTRARVRMHVCICIHFLDGSIYPCFSKLFQTCKKL